MKTPKKIYQLNMFSKVKYYLTRELAERFNQKRRYNWRIDEVINPDVIGDIINKNQLIGSK